MTTAARGTKCDLCAPAALALYCFPCPDITVKVPGAPEWRSRGGWLACAGCADLVVAGDLDGLVRRAPAMTRPVQAARTQMIRLFLAKRGEREVFG